MSPKRAYWHALDFFLVLPYFKSRKRTELDFLINNHINLF